MNTRSIQMLRRFRNTLTGQNAIGVALAAACAGLFGAAFGVLGMLAGWDIESVAGPATFFAASGAFAATTVAIICATVESAVRTDPPHEQLLTAFSRDASLSNSAPLTRNAPRYEERLEQLLGARSPRSV